MASLRRDIPISSEKTTQKLGVYYFPFQEDFAKLNKLLDSFDEQGIPLNKSYIDVETNNKLHYYPISIGQFGLAVFHSYLQTKNEEKRAHFLRIAEWFYTTRMVDPNLGVYWLTDVPKPEYEVFDPWKSAFSQSRGISMLLRAWQETNKEEYLKAATQALTPFTLDITEGGVSVDRIKHKPFYEEYVAKVPTRVIDGHMFALFGVYDFVRAVTPQIDAENHVRAQYIFDEGIKGLIEWLPEYDLGYWARFNNCELPGYPKYDPCTIYYLKLIVAQLKILYQITGREELNKYAITFSNYLKPKNILKMTYYKFKSLKKLNRL